MRDINEKSRGKEDKVFSSEIPIRNVLPFIGRDRGQNRKEDISQTSFVGEDIVLRKAIESCKKFASIENKLFSTLLITGETGTGKEIAARMIYQELKKNYGEIPFVKQNCAAIPKDLVESILFGHKKGSFTGSFNTTEGVFEQANGGIIFLDEIGDMPMEGQAKLLDVLQTKQVKKVGGKNVINLNIIIIAATNKDLKEEVKEKRFRKDLLHRLDVISIELPPLRERGEDVVLVAAHFLEKYRRNGFDKYLSKQAKQLLMCYSWPGNVRELENIIGKGVFNSEKTEISAEDLKINLSQREKNNSFLKTGMTFYEAIDAFKTEFIVVNLQAANGNRTQAAKIMGISRTYLYGLIKSLNLKDKILLPGNHNSRK